MAESLGPPPVSVIIPTFNSEPYIEATLRSVACQTFTHFETLVVDDCSTDGTCARVEAFAWGDNRIRLLRLADHAGRPAVPRNRGLAEARGELVAFLDSDDLWVRWKLEDQVAAMQSDSDLVLVYSILQTFGGGGLLAPDQMYGLIPLPSRAVLTRQGLERRNTIPCSSVLARRKAVLNVGGFDEDPELKAVEDYDLWLKLSRVGPIGFIPIIFGYYRIHSSRTSPDWETRNHRLRYLYEKHGLANYSLPRERNLPLRLARNLVHWWMMRQLRAVDWLERRRGRGFPVLRAA